MKIALRVLASLALVVVVASGLVAGLAVLPVVSVHVQTGSIPNGMALRIDAGPRVHLRVVSTATAGGKPRYEYRMSSFAEPQPISLEGRVLTADCVLAEWAAALGQSCHGELLVVVKAGRPIRPNCFGEPFIKPDIAPDIFVEEDGCSR